MMIKDSTVTKKKDSLTILFEGWWWYLFVIYGYIRGQICNLHLKLLKWRWKRRRRRRRRSRWRRNGGRGRTFTEGYVSGRGENGRQRFEIQEKAPESGSGRSTRRRKPPWLMTLRLSVSAATKPSSTSQILFLLLPLRRWRHPHHQTISLRRRSSAYSLRAS